MLINTAIVMAMNIDQMSGGGEVQYLTIKPLTGRNISIVTKKVQYITTKPFTGRNIWNVCSYRLKVHCICNTMYIPNFILFNNLMNEQLESIHLTFVICYYILL